MRSCDARRCDRFRVPDFHFRFRYPRGRESSLHLIRGYAFRLLVNAHGVIRNLQVGRDGNRGPDLAADGPHLDRWSVKKVKYS